MLPGPVPGPSPLPYVFVEVRPTAMTSLDLCVSSEIRFKIKKEEIKEVVVYMPEEKDHPDKGGNPWDSPSLRML